MNKKKYALAAVMTVAAFFSVSAYATPFDNPSPGTLGNDIDGSGYFNQQDINPFLPAISFSAEIFDFLNEIGYGTTFGFYFQGAPSALNIIFDENDNTGDSLVDTATIDFLHGIIWDNDLDTLQGTFTYQDTSFGFFFSIGGTTLYSDPNLNGGTDVFGVFPVLGSPGRYLVQLQFPNVVSPSAQELFMGITPAPAPVPEPATLFLFCTGLAGLGTSYRRKRNK